MSPLWWVALAVVSVVALLALLQHLVFSRWAREMHDEFEKAFPGVCPICSYHTYLLMHGYDVDLQPVLHNCRGKYSMALYGTRDLR